MSRIKIILNPTAGMNAAKLKIPMIKELLLKYDIDYEMEITQRAKHAEEIARNTNANDFHLVVAAGGDGTCNEVLNGLMHAKAAGSSIPAMGALSIGRGNDFQFGAGLSNELEESIKTLKFGKKKLVDVGKVIGGNYPNGRYFGNGIGVGFSTIVSFEASKFKFIHGFITYIIGAIKTLFLYYHAPQIKMELDSEEINERFLEISVMIGQRFGGAFLMAPDAIDDDGLFDLCIADNPPRLEMLKLFGKYLKGTQSESQYISKRQSRKVTLTAIDGALAVHADGETICENGTSIEVDCLPKYLEIIIPERKV